MKKITGSILLFTALWTTNIYAEKPSFEKTLSSDGITFKVATTGEGSLRQLTITPSGLEGDNTPIKREIEGTVSGAEIADINKDGSPEIYIYINSAGSGSYGSIVAYSSNNKKSISKIYLPAINNDKKNSIGYMGHDKFSITKNTITREFPIYKKDDANCCPKGGTRHIEYKLIQGEAGWQLKVNKSTTH